MLTDLLIKNYALIEQLKLKPHESLNIITGETGAGKSIMLGAIGLLLGNRADLKVLFNKEEKCVIEGNFLIWSYNLNELFKSYDLDYDDHTTIRREITPSGKSRAFINDTPVNLEALRAVGRVLIDIHSQHDNLLLTDNSYQLKIVDACAENQPILEKYQDLYSTYKTLNTAFNKLKNEFTVYQKEHDFNAFLLEELVSAALKEDEQDALEKEIQVLENAEEVKIKLNALVNFLENPEMGINEQFRPLVSDFGKIKDFSDEFSDIHQRLESCLFELKDVASELQREEEKVEHDDARISEVQERLDLIYRLQQKHQVKSIAEILSIQENLEEKVNKVLNFDEEIETLKADLLKARKEMLEVATVLTQNRKSIAPEIENQLYEIVKDLGMPNAVIKIEFEETEPNQAGTDFVKFLFSANKGVKPEEIAKVASGGEFSRLMLAIKYLLAGKTAMPTVIFDEIDTGISGEIALKMGEMFKEMAKKHQIIAISHLHQIAAKGNYHYFVYKDHSSERTISRIKMLSDDERVQEIAKMISGSNPSQGAILSAKELLAS